MTDEKFAVQIARLQEGQETNKTEHGEIKQGQRDIWDAVKDLRDNLIDELKKRPPLWATFLITAQFGTITALLVAYLNK